MLQRQGTKIAFVTDFYPIDDWLPSGLPDLSWYNIPNIPKWPQNIPNSHIISNGCKMDRMTIQIWPKLAFLVWKYTLWQRCLTFWATRVLSFQGCQMVYLKTKYYNLGIVWNIMAIWYTYIMGSSGIMSPLLVCCTNKNLPTLSPMHCPQYLWIRGKSYDRELPTAQRKRWKKSQRHECVLKTK
jgi:hypothetical protein